jgi:mRNA interferase YafQ
MRRIEPTTQFKRDYKREAKGQHRATLDPDALDAEMKPVLEALVNDLPLAPRHHDHALSGDWKDHRDCHIKPDLLLIYRKPDAVRLQLVRLGSHAELSL